MAAEGAGVVGLPEALGEDAAQVAATARRAAGAGAAPVVGDLACATLAEDDGLSVPLRHGLPIRTKAFSPELAFSPKPNPTDPGPGHRETLARRHLAAIGVEPAVVRARIPGRHARILGCHARIVRREAGILGSKRPPRRRAPGQRQTDQEPTF